MQIPSRLALPLKASSSKSQVIIEAAAATVLVKQAVKAVWFMPKALPALKPYQPSQRMAVPKRTQGRL